MKTQKFSFHNIAVFLTVVVALCAMAAVFISREVGGADCDTEGIWTAGSRSAATKNVVWFTSDPNSPNAAKPAK